METGVATTERQPVQGSFTIESVDQLRKQQLEQMYEASVQAISELSLEDAFTKGAGVREEARTKAGQYFNDQNSEFLARYYDKDSNPDAFHTVLGQINAVSYNNMSHEAYYLGDKDQDGNYQYETSGRYKMQQLIEQLVDGTPQTEEDAPAPTEPTEKYSDFLEKYAETEEYKAANATLSAARNELANLSAQRRQRLNQKRGKRRTKELAEQFEAAQQRYDEAFQALGVMKALALKNAGYPTGAVTTAVITDVINEKQTFTAAEYQVLEADNSKQGRFAKWLANKHHLEWFSVGTGLGLGYGIKAAVAGAAGVFGGIVLPVGIAAGAAVGSTKAVLMATVGNKAHLHRNFDERASEDAAELNNAAHGLKESDDHEALVASSSDILQGNISHRIERDTTSNRRRVYKAMALSAGAAVVGEALAGLHASPIDHPFHDHQWHPFGDHDHGFDSSGNHADNSGSVNSGPDNPVTHGHGGNNSGNGGGGSHGSGHHAGGANANVVDGYHTNVTVEAGHGYTNELQDLAAQKGYHLTGAQAWKAYQTMNDHLHGHFFTNDHSYLRSQGDWGISHPGSAHWNPNAIDQFNSWMHQHQDALAKTSKVGKKAAKLALAGKH